MSETSGPALAPVGGFCLRALARGRAGVSAGPCLVTPVPPTQARFQWFARGCGRPDASRACPWLLRPPLSSGRLLARPCCARAQATSSRTAGLFLPSEAMLSTVPLARPSFRTLPALACVPQAPLPPGRRASPSPFMSLTYFLLPLTAVLSCRPSTRPV